MPTTHGHLWVEKSQCWKGMAYCWWFQVLNNQYPRILNFMWFTGTWLKPSGMVNLQNTWVWAARNLYLCMRRRCTYRGLEFGMQSRWWIIRPFLFEEIWMHKLCELLEHKLDDEELQHVFSQKMVWHVIIWLQHYKNWVLFWGQNHLMATMTWRHLS